MKINVICKECGSEFIGDTRYTKRGQGIFCSQSCATTYQHKHKEKPIKLLNAVCAYCGDEFHKTPSSQRKSRSGLFFCTRACKDKAQRIGGIKAIQPSHYNDEVKWSYKQVVLRNRKMDKCDVCGYDEHTEILQIHHKDRNRLNNNIDNLVVVCPNCHQWDHYIGNDGAYKYKNGGACPKAGDKLLQSS